MKPSSVLEGSDINSNRITVDDFSNPESRRRYETQSCEGPQCGGCSFFAPFNSDFGLCCHPESEHHLETVFEHFSCDRIADEGWGPHSFSQNAELHCRCQGEPIHETMGTIIALLDRSGLDPEQRSHLRALRSYVDSVQKR